MRKRFEGRLELLELEPRIAPSAIFGPLLESMAGLDALSGPEFVVDGADESADASEDTTLDDVALADASDPLGAVWGDAGEDTALISPAVEWAETPAVESDADILVTVDVEAPLSEMTPTEVQVEIAAAPDTSAGENGSRTAA